MKSMCQYFQNPQSTRRSLCFYWDFGLIDEEHFSVVVIDCPLMPTFIYDTNKGVNSTAITIVDPRCFAQIFNLIRLVAKRLSTYIRWADIKVGIHSFIVLCRAYLREIL